MRLGVHDRGRGPGDTASLPYFTVADMATTLERVGELGGSVIHPGKRWAICRDSEGSPFALAAAPSPAEAAEREARSAAAIEIRHGYATGREASSKVPPRWQDACMADEPDLVRNDPESEATLDVMTAIIAEELSVRASMGDQIETQADAHSFAAFAADALLDRFVIRPRDPGRPRYTWTGDATA